MISDKVVGVRARTESGKNACRRLRATGRVPGVVYGMNLDPFAVSVADRTINDILHLETGRNTIFTLSLEGSDKKSTRAVMIKDLQRDPVKENLLHVDFIRVDMEQKVTVNVPVQLVGIAEGVKNEGGIIDFNQRFLLVECLPGDIPSSIELDISGLHLNQNALVKDVVAPKGVELLDDPGNPIAAVVAPRGLEVAEEEVAEGEEIEGEEGEAEKTDEDKAEDKSDSEESKDS